MAGLLRDSSQVDLHIGNPPGLANAPGVPFTVGAAGAHAGAELESLGATIIGAAQDQMKAENLQKIENDAYAVPILKDENGIPIRPATPARGSPAALSSSKRTPQSPGGRPTAAFRSLTQGIPGLHRLHARVPAPAVRSGGSACPARFPVASARRRCVSP